MEVSAIEHERGLSGKNGDFIRGGLPGRVYTWNNRCDYAESVAESIDSACKSVSGSCVGARNQHFVCYGGNYFDSGLLL